MHNDAQYIHICQAIQHEKFDGSCSGAIAYNESHVCDVALSPTRAKGHVAERRAAAPRSPRRPEGAPMYIRAVMRRCVSGHLYISYRPSLFRDALCRSIATRSEALMSSSHRRNSHLRCQRQRTVNVPCFYLESDGDTAGVKTNVIVRA